jgi:hypothetical protein
MSPSLRRTRLGRPSCTFGRSTPRLRGRCLTRVTPRSPSGRPTASALASSPEGQLKIVPLAGGSPRVLAGASVPRGGTWNRDDVILFVPIPGGSPRRIPSGGGEPIDVPVASGAQPWNLTLLFPTFLPDGRHYLYLGRRGADA